VSNSGTLSAAGCTQCPPGLSTGNLAGSTSQAACTSCAAGYIGSPSGGCTICPAGTWGQSGMMACVLCSPGTYSLAGSATCRPCPAGTYGSAAGLATDACSGTCSPASSCPPGTSSLPPTPPVTGLSCISSGTRAAPAKLNLLLWPAAHPANSRGVDLVAATLGVCQQLGGTCSTSAADTVAGADGALRYIVGTAAALHLEAAEPLACSPQ